MYLLPSHYREKAMQHHMYGMLVDVCGRYSLMTTLILSAPYSTQIPFDKATGLFLSVSNHT